MKKHLVQAAERGDPVAQLNLAIMYENGALDSRYTVDEEQAAPGPADGRYFAVKATTWRP